MKEEPRSPTSPRRHARFEKSLRDAAARWFENNERKVLPDRPYILDSRENWPNNIIDPEVVKYINREIVARKGFPLHSRAHHGLSSQAMLFNLVGPLIVQDDLAPLREACQEAGIAWPEGRVEARLEEEGETDGDRTSIDLMVRGTGGHPLFIECKLVETGFGGCSDFSQGDCTGANPSSGVEPCYLNDNRRYWKVMKKHRLISGPILTDRHCPFANHYQFFRELMFALKHDGVFVLLHDERSPTFWNQEKRGLVPFLLSLLPSEASARVKVLSTQQIVEKIRQSGRHIWIEDFRQKYGLV